MAFWWKSCSFATAYWARYTPLVGTRFSVQVPICFFFQVSFFTDIGKILTDLKLLLKISKQPGSPCNVCSRKCAYLSMPVCIDKNGKETILWINIRCWTIVFNLLKFVPGIESKRFVPCLWNNFGCLFLKKWCFFLSLKALSDFFTKLRVRTLPIFASNHTFNDPDWPIIK